MALQPVETRLWVIQHIPSGQLMPLYPSNKGYSNWEPGCFSRGVPRVFTSKKAAENAVTAWLKGAWLIRCDYKTGDCYTVIEPRNRRPDDMRVVPMTAKETS